MENFKGGGKGNRGFIGGGKGGRGFTPHQPGNHHGPHGGMPAGIHPPHGHHGGPPHGHHGGPPHGHHGGPPHGHHGGPPHGHHGGPPHGHHGKGGKGKGRYIWDYSGIQLEPVYIYDDQLDKDIYCENHPNDINCIFYNDDDELQGYNENIF